LSASGRGFTLFPTALGRCGIAWLGDVVIATHLPENDDAGTEARLRQRAPGAAEADPPPVILRAIDAVRELLEGGRADLSFIACDFGALDPLSVHVYRLARAIPPGETRTYGEVACDLGDKLLAQAVGKALGRNPFPIIVPCHRVMGAGGKLTGFSASGGVATKLKMLAIERAQPGGAPTLFGELPLAARVYR
jgi:methylated-DNA-[protein]-cysteine S-methyltransferase